MEYSKVIVNGSGGGAVIILRCRESDVFGTGTAQSSYVRMSQYIFQWIQMARNTVLRTDRKSNRLRVT